MINNNQVLNRLFTQHVFKDLVKNNHNEIYCSIIQRYLNDDKAENNGEVISKIYRYMSQNYRNEYFYQNTLLNKLLLGRHSINTTTALTQVPIGKSKADFVMINGKAIVYEIKTELDSFERLNTQLMDYYKAFNHVCVVTCSNNFEKLNQLLTGTPVGICVLSDNNTLQFKKEPTESNDNLSYHALFRILHKKEFERIILHFFDNLPNVAPAFYYDACFSLFSKVPVLTLYLKVLEQLKNRNRIVQEYYEHVPYELKSLIYFYNPSNQDYINLSKFLKRKNITGRK